MNVLLKNRDKIWVVILVCILVCAFFIRIYRLTDIPHGFFADEASNGYNAYSIAQSGRDEYGVFFPLFFQSLNDYKGPIEIYATVPFVMLFGLNEFAVRLPAVLFGVASIGAIYLLTKELCTKARIGHASAIALIAAFFLMISPWHIHFSRVAFEQMPYILCTILALYCFLLVSKNRLYFIAAIVLAVIALYTYFPARLFIPVFFFSVGALYMLPVS